MLVKQHKRHKIKRSKKTFIEYIISVGLVAVMIIISIPQAVFAQVMPNFSGSNKMLKSEIKLPNAEYTESSIDLTVKAQGGEIKLNRTWTNNRWYINPVWADLEFKAYEINKALFSINRAGVIYYKTDNSDLYSASQTYIKKTESGWQWYDRQGNWINYDNKGRITEYGDSNNNKVSFDISSEGRRTAIRDHHGELVYSFKYDANERLIEAKDRENRTVTYHWQGNLLVKVTDVLGNDWHYSYDDKGQLSQTTAPDTTINKIEYSNSTKAAETGMVSGKNAGQIEYIKIITAGSTGKSGKSGKGYTLATTGSQSRSGAGQTTFARQYNNTTKTYKVDTVTSGSSNRVSSRTYNKGGKVLDSAINGKKTEGIIRDNNIVKYTDERGYTNTAHFDSIGRVIKIIRADGSSESFAYENIFNKVTHFTDAQGNVYKYNYDSKGNLVQTIAGEGKGEQQTTLLKYDNFGQPTTIILKSKDRTITLSQTFDAYGNVTSFTDGNGHTYQFTYNIQGQATSVTNPLHNTWQTTYNAIGYPTAIIDPLNHRYTYTTDSMGRVTSIINPLGKVTNYNYQFSDGGWQVNKTNALNETQSYYFDTDSHFIKGVLPSGLEITQAYDIDGNLIQQTDMAGNIYKYAYGAKNTKLSGLLTKVTYPTYSETYQYNALGFPTQITQIIDAQNQLINRIGYNELNVPTTITKANNTITTLHWNAFRQATGLTDALGSNSKQEWDIFSNVAKLTDPKGNIYQFNYDNNGNLIKETKAISSIVGYVYDAANQKVKEQDSAGNIIIYQYDKAGRLTQKDYSLKEQTSPSQTIVYNYDTANQLTSIIQTGDTHSQFNYMYDDLGRIVKETITYGIGTQKITNTLKYTYDLDGNLTSLTYPDNSQTSFSYEKGLIKDVQLANDEKITWEQYTWLKPSLISFPGATKAINYDGLLRPTNIKVTNNQNNLLMNRDYLYDKVHNITSLSNEKGQTQYDYDLLNRLTTITPSQSLQQMGLNIEAYSYDTTNNRIGNSQDSNWLYNTKNQLIQYGKNNQHTLLTYTENGNLATETKNNKTLTYQYNAANRLTTISDGLQQVAYYQYDPFGRRISKTIKGETIYYLYTKEGLIGELNEQGTMLVAYGWEPNTQWGTQPLWQANLTQGSNLTTTKYNYLYTDHLGAPQLAVDNQGRTTWKGITEAFGKINLDINNQTIINLRFPGQYFDQETGLHYNGFRHYNPNIGRYTQVDFMGIHDGLNVYEYVASNPIMYLDFNGLAHQISTGVSGSIMMGPVPNPYNTPLNSLFNTLFPFSLGVGGGPSIGISIPESLIDLDCYQIFVQSQANTFPNSYGLYAGIGLTGSYAKSDGPLKQGSSTDKGEVSELNVAIGLSAGASGSTSSQDNSDSPAKSKGISLFPNSKKLGVGLGAAFGKGYYTAVSYVFNEVDECKCK